MVLHDVIDEMIHLRSLIDEDEMFMRLARYEGNLAKVQQYKKQIAERKQKLERLKKLIAQVEKQSRRGA